MEKNYQLCEDCVRSLGLWTHVPSQFGVLINNVCMMCNSKDHLVYSNVRLLKKKEKLFLKAKEAMEGRREEIEIERLEQKSW